MGGLGNQLFQLAAGMHYSRDGAILVDNLGNPRRNRTNEPEISSFTLPNCIKIESGTPSALMVRKLTNFGIRLGARTPKRNLKIRLYEGLVNLTSALSYKNRDGINLSIGTGFDSRFRVSTSHLNIGYFQAKEFCENEAVFQKLMTLKIAKPSNQFLTLEKIAKVVKPIVVHIRLGDYLMEESFGIPSSSYYQQGIQRLTENKSETPIWLFSNDPGEAIKLISESDLGKVFTVPPQGLSSAETLELMRLGSAYVIANSTFSWWGAMLSYNTNSEVVSPTPWFKSGIAPKTIHPDLWTQIAANYENKTNEIWRT
jgi:hypothetical protein